MGRSRRSGGPRRVGVRDSGPYLHDGRAPTLEHAVALHGGQAERSSKAYFGLKPEGGRRSKRSSTPW